MVGITSIGAYIPIYRLSREEVGKMWLTKGSAGGRAVAGYDEDTVTMAVAAALDCVKGNGRKVDGLYFATTTAPYKEKQSAAIIASAVDLDKECDTADLTNSLRAGTTAMKGAIGAVESGAATQVLVVAADCRLGAPKGRFEQILGDGAGAVMIGSTDPIATIEGSYSIFSDFTDLWRTNNDDFIQSGEVRFIEEAGYIPTMQEAVQGLMKKYSLAPADFSKIVFYAIDSRQHTDMAKRLGFEKSQVQDPFFGQIGNTGAAQVLVSLVAALEEAAPGDRILVAGYGDGSDTFIVRATEHVSTMHHRKPSMKDMLARTVPVDYGRYLSWRDLIPTEPSALPERAEPSLAPRWRERKVIRALYGVKCRKCGTPQIHTIGQSLRVCIACRAKDEFEDYKFSDKRGKLFTYAIDKLQPTKNSPGLNGVIDFDGGGRWICELTDYDVSKAATGMPVEVTFRKLSQGKGIVNYFWKAKPVLE
jgi:3-hydroxy-3-methylglutaryl CoA synthase